MVLQTMWTFHSYKIGHLKFKIKDKVKNQTIPHRGNSLKI